MQHAIHVPRAGGGDDERVVAGGNIIIMGCTQLITYFLGGPDRPYKAHISLQQTSYSYQTASQNREPLLGCRPCSSALAPASAAVPPNSKPSLLPTAPRTSLCAAGPRLSPPLPRKSTGMADEAHLRSAVPGPWAAGYREKAVHYCTTPSISVESLYVFCAYTLPGPSLGTRGRAYAMDLLQLTHRDYTFYMMTSCL